MADMSRRRKHITKPTTAAETEIKPANHEKKITIRIDEHLHEQFRRITFNQGISMNEILTQTIEKYVANNH